MNFRELQSATFEDEMRLMTLIAEIGYRIYELPVDDEDFTKARSYFSGTMQKCMSIVNDKSIVGGAVNRAKDMPEKAGERGRELRVLQKKWGKVPPEERPQANEEPEVEPPPPEPDHQDEPEQPEEPEAPKKPSVFDVDVATGNVQELEKNIEQLDAENKQWMRLAGMSAVRGLPNRVLLSKVLLPSAFRQAAQRREPVGCVFLAPLGLEKINATHGRKIGDTILQKSPPASKNSSEEVNASVTLKA